MKVLFTDLDGTIIYSSVGNHTPNNINEIRFFPNVKKYLKKYKNMGYVIIGVTNKGGIAFGFQTHTSVQQIHSYINKELGGVFDKIFYSGVHPKGTIKKYRVDKNKTRKPNTGMAEMANQYVYSKYGEYIDFDQSIMVGNEETDAVFADNSGIGSFYWAHEFFDFPKDMNVA